MSDQGLVDGVLYLFCPHTTAGLTLNENWDPDVKRELGSLYYDTSGGFNLPVQIPALLGIDRPERMLCGSDYPFTPATVGGQMLDDVRTTDLLTEEQKTAVLRTNALGLFPRFS